MSEQQQLDQQQLDNNRNAIIEVLITELKIESEEHEQNIKSEKKRHEDGKTSKIRTRAIELLRTNMDKTEILKLLFATVVNVEPKLAGERTVYRALEDEIFSEIKARQQSDAGKAGTGRSKSNPASQSVANQDRLATEYHQPTCVEWTYDMCKRKQEENPNLTMKQIRGLVLEEAEKTKAFSRNTVRTKWPEEFKKDNIANITVEEQPKSEQEEKQPQWILDARQAIKDSNDVQSLMGQLMDKLTGMTEAEQSRIKDEMEKGKIYRMEIAEKSKDHMLRMTKQIPEGHINTTLGVLQTLHFLMDKFEELLSDEVILRKSKSEVSGV